MIIKKMGLFLILTSSVQLCGITEKVFKRAVGASVVPAVVCFAQACKEVVSKECDSVERSQKLISIVPWLALLPVTAYGILRGKTPAGRLRTVTAQVDKIGKHRFVADPDAPYIQGHTETVRFLSLDQEGIRHSVALENMHKDLTQAHADATSDNNNTLLTQIEARKVKVEEYQYNVATNLSAARKRLNIY